MLFFSSDWVWFIFPNFLFIFLNFSQDGGVRRVRSKKRNDGGALGVVYAPLVSVMHAGFSDTVLQ